MTLVLSASQLATVAKGLLEEHYGFTLDEFGKSITGDFWAVSVKGREMKYTFALREFIETPGDTGSNNWSKGSPTIEEIEQYLLRFPILADGHPTAAFFGGWIDFIVNPVICYLDHTLLFAHKHTAVQEGLRQEQKAIYHLSTGEVLSLEDTGIPK